MNLQPISHHEDDRGCGDCDPDNLVPGGEEGLALLGHRVDARRLHRRLVFGPRLLPVLEVAGKEFGTRINNYSK